jgi:hypothetical protein
VSGKRGERAAPPPGSNEFDVRFSCNEAGKGWDDLIQQAPANLLAAWREMRASPAPAVQTARHHRLRHTLASDSYKGQVYPQWQIEVTGGGRIWYLFDEERRTCWIHYAGTGHPKATD